MKYIYIAVFCGLFLLSCSNTPAPDAIVEIYYDGLNTSNFERVHSVLSDSITFKEGGYATTVSRDDYYVMFQWDSVFTPHTILSDIDVSQDQVTAMVATTSQRYTYLEHTPYACETTFTVEEGKITTHATGVCPDASNERWEARRDTLVAWIDQHHPHLSGFIHDLTKAGAEKYMEAIRLYEEASE